MKIMQINRKLYREIQAVSKACDLNKKIIKVIHFQSDSESFHLLMVNGWFLVLSEEDEMD